MKRGRTARRSRRGLAGIIATVIMFAILFTVGTSYFLFVNSTNSQYVNKLVSASGKLQSSLGESLLVTTLLNNGDVAFYVNNTSGQNINMTVVYVLASSGGLLKCLGVGLPASASCGNTLSPNLLGSAVVNAGKGSLTYDTGCSTLSGQLCAVFPVTVKILTQRGNTFTATYPNNSVNQAVQAQTAQAMTINLATYRWVQLIPQPTSLVQTKFVQNCNAANCGASFASSVGAGHTLVYALGWFGGNPPATPTDTRGDAYTLGSFNSGQGTFTSPYILQTKYNKNCNSQNCALAYTSSVTAGSTLVYALGWSNNNPPASAPTDTLGNSFTLGVSNSVGTTANANPSVVQTKFNKDCANANCAQAFGGSVASGNLLVAALGWKNTAPPSTPTDTLGNTYTLAVSNSVVATQPPTEVQSQTTFNCGSANCGRAFGSNVVQGNLLVIAIGWADQNPPSTPTDTLSDTFTLAVSNSVSTTSPSHTYYSYVWYARAISSGADTITAAFNTSVAGTVLVSEITGAATGGLTTSTGSSASNSNALSVTSFTPAANSYVLGSATTAATATYTQGSGYTLETACNSRLGCWETKEGMSSATTVPMSLGSSTAWVETAVAFLPATSYSYLWYTTTGSSGADTVTAAFSGTAFGTLSLYELNGFTATGLITATGSSASPSASASVSTMNPSPNSIVIGNIETGSSYPTWTAGSGYATIKGGGAGCDATNANYGCDEYNTNPNASTTVSWSLGTSEAWVEVAASFSPTPTYYYSYIWYATAASAGADTITAAFTSTVAGSVSMYELTEVSTTDVLTSTGSSSTGSSTTAVDSFTPVTNSIVIGNAENSASAANWKNTGGYTIILGGGGGCGAAYGCSAYDDTVVSGSQTVPMNPSGVGSVPWVESAIAFQPGVVTFYSYIWYATAITTGADTVTAAFSGAVTGTVSLYELNGYSTSGVLASTGNSTAPTTAASVTGLNAYQGATTIGNVEDGDSATGFTPGAGYTLVPGGACGSGWGCSEYSTTVTGSTTIPMTLAKSTPWVEAAVSFGPLINPASGFQVGGYPSMGVPDKTTLAWHVNFTNTDAGHRSVTLWPQSEIAVTSVKNGGHHRNDYFIIDNVNSGASGLVPYTGTNGLFTTVPYGGTITLWFAATVPLGSHVDIIDFDNNQPFQAFFSLTGVFGDGKLYGETIPYPSGIINNAHAQLSTTVGPTGTVVTLTCGGPCNYKLSQSAMIGWIDGSGTMTPLKTFATDNNGNIPPNTTFTIPAATPGYYTVMVTDFVNTYFVTFQHT